MSRNLTTWRVELEKARKNARDSTPIVAVAPDQATLDVEFDAGFGGSRGLPLLAWSEARVYFPVVYDGAEWIGSAPRNPEAEGQAHVGGE